MALRRSSAAPPATAPRPVSRAQVRGALREDRAGSDRTSRALFPRRTPAWAEVIAQRAGTLSGVEVARAIAREAGLRARPRQRDGARVRAGTVVLELRGDLRSILAVERTLLNFVMHLSGVATATRETVAAAGPGLRVYATRKTLPGFRDLEKAAVQHGGGYPHRRDLSSAILVKNNHLAFLPFDEAVRRARRARGSAPVQIEVRSARQALEAVRAGADALLLDNQTPRGARAIVAALERDRLRSGVWIELSGGMTPSTVRRYRSVGADAVSSGALTHSAPAVPFHLRVRPVPIARPRRSG